MSGGKPPFPTCEFAYLDRLRVDEVVLEQNKAELSGGKPPFPTCELSYLDRLRVDGRVLQQDKVELIGHHAMPDPWPETKARLSPRQVTLFPEQTGLRISSNFLPS